MNTAGYLVLIAVALIIGGLLMIRLCGGIKQVLMQLIIYWSGVGVAILGLVLLLFPVVAFLYRTVTAAFGL